ncbi:hypothetical protein D3C76_846180 [compost metagenome]
MIMSIDPVEIMRMSEKTKKHYFIVRGKEMNIIVVEYDPNWKNEKYPISENRNVQFINNTITKSNIIVGDD